MNTEDRIKWIEILQKERELLLEKIKSGSYAAIFIVIPMLFIILDAVLNRDPFFPLLGGTTQILVYLIILLAVVLGPLFLVFRNWMKYTQIETISDRLLSGEIHTNKKFYATFDEVISYKKSEEEKKQRERIISKNE